MKRILFSTLVAVSLIAFPLVTALAQSGCAVKHTVRAGENLFRIGLRYGLAWPVLVSANHLANPNRIFVGQVLCIPTVRATLTPAGTMVGTPTATRTATPVSTTSATPVTPAPPSKTPTATSPTSTGIPTFAIVSVARDQTVTIRAVNFPANQTFDVLMGPIGTRGINGTPAGTQASGTGAFTATYTIPASLKGARQIAIRLQSTAGYFSYNWFYNASAAAPR